MATQTLDFPTVATPDVPPEQREEAAAVQAALDGGMWKRARLALGALHKLRRDPNDTRQVFILSIAVSAGHLPKLLTQFLANDDGMELLRTGASIDSGHVDYDTLRALPENTLGGAYARFLDERGLDPDLFQAPPGMPAGVAYVMKRMRQTHDLWHVVTGYDSDIPGEISLLSFTYGQTGAPSMRILALFGCLRFGLLNPRMIPELWRSAWRGYRRGQRAAFMGNQLWERMWTSPLSEVRNALGVEPLTA